MDPAVAAFRADPDVRRLSRIAKISWPTVGLGLVCMAAFFGTWYLVLTEQIHPLAAMFINLAACFFLFVVVHDAAHKTISTNGLFNDVFGTLGGMIMAPGLNAVFYRWVHTQHHQYLGDREKDVDQFVFVGPKWRHPFNWFTGDIVSTKRYLAVLPERSLYEKVFFFGSFGATILIIAGLAVAGLFTEFLLYWFLPSRFALFFLALTVAYIPHNPGGLLEKDAPLKASRIIVGYEWLLSPLLIFQNYHLIHHLAPTVPVYHQWTLWRLKKDFLIQNGANVTYLGKKAPTEAQQAI